MITEDYVSFETAKLLKEKGFDEATNRYYNAQYDQIRTVSDTFMWHWNDEEFMKRVLMEGAIAIPTLQMAMKWLRENFNINPVPYALSLGWYFEVFDLTQRDITGCALLYQVGIPSKEQVFKSSEEACEAAIKYCLENLI